jgi:DNA-binding FadR family transcriptional regulator
VDDATQRQFENLSQALRRRPTKTSVAIAVDLADYIISSDLPAGAALPNEKEMVDKLGVGRASVREALRLLETRGLIRIRSGVGGGPVVCRPEASDFSAAVEFALQAERASLGEVLRAREDLSPFLARLAATRRTTVQAKELRATVDSLRDALDDDAAFALHGRRCEAQIAEAGGNVVVRLLSDALIAILWDTVPGVEYPLSRRRDVARHLEGVVDAVIARDSDAAEQRMATFVRSGTRYWKKSYPDLATRRVRWRG